MKENKIKPSADFCFYEHRMTSDPEKIFSKFKGYYECLYEFGIKSDGRYCHTQYILDVAWKIYDNPNNLNPKYDTEELKECHKREEIDIPYEFLVCKIQQDWAAYLDIQIPYLGPMPITYRAVNGSGATAKKCMQWFADKSVEIFKLNTGEKIDEYMKKEHGDKCFKFEFDH